LVLLLRFVGGVDDRRPFSEVDIVPSRTRKSFELIIIIVCWVFYTVMTNAGAERRPAKEAV